MAESQSADAYADYSEFYDVYVGHRKIDLAFYLGFAKNAGTPVLEIGAGTGRLTIPMAREGVSVVAVDISSSMLAILKDRIAEEPPEIREKIEVVEADMCRLELDARYDLTMVPYYTFNYLMTDEEQSAALESIRAHLTPHGYVLIDVYIPWGRMEHCPPDPISIVDAIDPRTGNRVQGWNTFTLDKEKQMEYRAMKFDVTQTNGAVIEKQFFVHRRYDLPDQLEHLFSTNGFRIDGVFGGYHQEEPQPNSEQLMYVLKRS